MLKNRIVLFALLNLFCFIQCQKEIGIKPYYIEQLPPKWVNNEVNIYNLSTQINGDINFYLAYVQNRKENNVTVQLRTINSNKLIWDWKDSRINSLELHAFSAYFLENSIVLFGTNDIFCLNKQSGSILWEKRNIKPYNFNFIKSNLLCITIVDTSLNKNTIDHIEIFDVNNSSQLSDISIPYPDSIESNIITHKKVLNVIHYNNSEGDFISAVYATLQDRVTVKAYQGSYSLKTESWIYSKALLNGGDGRSEYQQFSFPELSEIIINTGEHLLFLDEANGSVKTEYNFEIKPHYLKTFQIENSIYAFVPGSGLYNIDIISRSKNWHLSIVDYISQMLFFENRIFFVDQFYKRLWNVDHNTGTIYWLLVPYKYCCFDRMLCISRPDKEKNPFIIASSTNGLQAFEFTD